MYEIKDKVVLVTGGAAGIGAGVVKAFLEDGAKHVAALDVDTTNGRNLVRELSAQHGPSKIKFYKCDVTTNDLDTAYQSIVKEFGYIDVVINCAGIMNDDRRVYLKEIQVNVSALITSSFKAYDLMRKDHGGRGGTIINISSIVGLMNPTLLPVYGATKSAVLQFSTCLGMEPHYSRSDVRVLTLCFGCTNTSLLTAPKMAAFDEETDEMLNSSIGMLPIQETESAVRGLLDAYKTGESASTWLITSDEPAKNITANVLKAYAILSQGVFPTKDE